MREKQLCTCEARFHHAVYHAVTPQGLAVVKKKYPLCSFFVSATSVHFQHKATLWRQSSCEELEREVLIFSPSTSQAVFNAAESMRHSAPSDDNSGKESRFSSYTRGRDTLSHLRWHLILWSVVMVNGLHHWCIRITPIVNFRQKILTCKGIQLEHMETVSLLNVWTVVESWLRKRCQSNQMLELPQIKRLPPSLHIWVNAKILWPACPTSRLTGRLSHRDFQSRLIWAHHLMTNSRSQW